MSLPIYGAFRFEVGQFVQSKFSTIDGSGPNAPRDCYQILERIYQECPGGIQLHYVCRRQGGAFGMRDNAAIRLNEIELVPFEKGT